MIKLSPTSGKGTLNAAKVSRKFGDEKSAEKYLRTALRLDPKLAGDPESQSIRQSN